MVSLDFKLEIHEAILDCLPKLTYWLTVQLYSFYDSIHQLWLIQLEVFISICFQDAVKSC